MFETMIRSGAVSPGAIASRTRKAADRAALVTRQLLCFNRGSVHEPVTMDLTGSASPSGRLAGRTP